MYTAQLKRMDTKKNIILLILVGILIVTAASGCKREPTEPSTKPEPKPNSIHEAAKIGSKTAVEEFLLKGNNVNIKDKYGMTPLHYAAAYGQKEAAELLLANGAEVDARNERGGTPLGQAVMGVGHNKEVAELLVRKGADVNSRNLDGRTRLDDAAETAQNDKEKEEDLKNDPDGNRIFKDSGVSGERKYIVDVTGKLPVILMELDSADNMDIMKKYISAHSQVLAQHDIDDDAMPAKDDIYFYLHDRTGSVRQMLDTSTL